jgi:hypothetical protein
MNMVQVLMKEIACVYIFLDGLDEEDGYGKQVDINRILDLALDLSTTFTNQIRIWFSTQD